MKIFERIKKFFGKKKIICPRCRGSNISRDDMNYTTNEALFSYKCNKCRIHFIPYAGYTGRNSGYSGYRKDYLRKGKRV